MADRYLRGIAIVGCLAVASAAALAAAQGTAGLASGVGALATVLATLNTATGIGTTSLSDWADEVARGTFAVSEMGDIVPKVVGGMEQVTKSRYSRNLATSM